MFVYLQHLDVYILSLTIGRRDAVSTCILQMMYVPISHLTQMGPANGRMHRPCAHFFAFSLFFRFCVLFICVPYCLWIKFIVTCSKARTSRDIDVCQQIQQQQAQPNGISITRWWMMMMMKTILTTYEITHKTTIFFNFMFALISCEMYHKSGLLESKLETLNRSPYLVYNCHLEFRNAVCNTEYQMNACDRHTHTNSHTHIILV